jgi:hypothetical protein
VLILFMIGRAAPKKELVLPSGFRKLSSYDSWSVELVATPTSGPALLVAGFGDRFSDRSAYCTGLS